jgi:hypothetical protein
MREREIEEITYIPTEKDNGSKKLKLKSFLAFSTKGSCGLLRESTFTPNEVPMTTSML